MTSSPTTPNQQEARTYGKAQISLDHLANYGVGGVWSDSVIADLVAHVRELLAAHPTPVEPDDREEYEIAGERDGREAAKAFREALPYPVEPSGEMFDQTNLPTAADVRGIIPLPTTGGTDGKSADVLLKPENVNTFQQRVDAANVSPPNSGGATPEQENVFRVWWTNAIENAAHLCRKEAQRYANLANDCRRVNGATDVDARIFSHRANQSKELEDAIRALDKTPYHTGRSSRATTEARVGERTYEDGIETAARIADNATVGPWIMGVSGREQRLIDEHADKRAHDIANAIRSSLTPPVGDPPSIPTPPASEVTITNDEAADHKRNGGLDGFGTRRTLNPPARGGRDGDDPERDPSNWPENM